MYALTKEFYTLLKGFVENLLFFIIRFDVILIYSFSQTILVVFYIFAVIAGFCAGDKTDISTIFMFLFASYLCGSSILLTIVCHSRSTMSWVGKLVGIHFLDKFAPKKGRTSCLIFVLLLITLLFLDLVSMQFVISQDLSECSQLTQTIKFLKESGQADPEILNNLFLKKCELLQYLSNSKGYVRQVHDIFPLANIHKFFNKL